MTDQSIGEILNDGEPTAEVSAEASAVEAPVAVTETPTETVERARGPDGKFIAKGETEGAPPAPAEETGFIPIAAQQDERRKRQLAEQERDELRQQLAQFQAQPQPQGPPDRWEDPEGYDQWLIGQASAAARDQAMETYNIQRIQTAATQFQADKPDYHEAIGVFGQMVERNPALVAQMQQAPNPAQFAYETAKLQIELMQHGGIDGLVEARLKAREAAAMQGVQGRLPQSAPPTISTERSVGARTGPAWSGPASLTELLS